MEIRFEGFLYNKVGNEVVNAMRVGQSVAGAWHWYTILAPRR